MITTPNWITINLDNLKRIQSLTWDKYSLSNSNSIWNNYQIESFPHYTLIDATGYIVSNPALGPTPNGQYETIDKTFFHIQKAWHEANPNEKEYSMVFLVELNVYSRRLIESGKGIGCFQNVFGDEFQRLADCLGLE